MKELISKIGVFILVVVLFFSRLTFVDAKDWQTFRGDASRSGQTSERLPTNLELVWTYKSMHAPVPAWPDEERMTFDWAFQVVVADGTLFFGSSADCGVHALDATTGGKRWIFYTGGPVRFAPVVWNDRVFVASDDGFLYCLSAHDGKIRWKKRGGPDGRLLVGNNRMISRWPVRGGPVVVDDTVYFAAGIWPADGVYVYALEAESGKQVWVNDTLGLLERSHPHQGKEIQAGIGVQGYLAVTEEMIVIPSGRSTPLFCDRASGTFKYFRPAKNVGGSGVTVIDSLFYNGQQAYTLKDGELAFGSIRKHTDTSRAAVSATDYLIFRGGVDGLQIIDRAKPAITKQDGKKLLRVVNVKKTLPVPCAGDIIVAGNTAICGGDGCVTAVDGKTSESTWTANVDGIVHGLAVADERLYVTTDTGEIHCFGSEGGNQFISEQKIETPFGKDDDYAAAAEEIIKKSGLTRGCCLDIDCGDGQLVFELARRSDFYIVGIEKDPIEVAQARKKLASAGLYGVRAIVRQYDPEEETCPSQFANLIVSGRSVFQGARTAIAKEAARFQRPWGGTICMGKPGTMQIKVRGALIDAGAWTHLYANAANTGSSADRLVKGPLRMYWFGGPSLNVPNRHGRPPGPLFYEGRLYALGMNAIRAVDAYNGHFIWEFPLDGIGAPYKGKTLFGVSGTGGDYCIGPEGLFVRNKNKCLRIDAVTGEKLDEFATPKRPDGQPSDWGHLSLDGGLLFGTTTNDAHLIRRGWATFKTESNSLFAMDANTGKTQWTYRAKYSIRNNTIATGGERVFLIDRPVAAFEQGISPARRGEHPSGELVALRVRDGKQLWRLEDIEGTALMLSIQHDVLLVSTQSGRFALPSDAGNKLAAYRASSGQRLWGVEQRYRTRPIIIGDTVHAEPYAYKLTSGEKSSFNFFRLHGCGTILGCPSLLLFRSGPLGYVDLTSGKTGKRAVEYYGGTRPGCWANAIPAGGSVFLPNSFNSCSCSYLNRTNIALRGIEER